jgi:hypothetical protein
MRLLVKFRRKNAVAVALYINAALLAGVLLALLSRDSAPQLLPAAFAQNQQPIAGGAGLFMMPAQFSTNTWGCYLMDVDQQTLSAYQYLPGEHQLRLVAARNFRYDRRLGNYNTGNPSPAEVKDLVEKEAAGARGKQPESPGVAP